MSSRNWFTTIFWFFIGTIALSFYNASNFPILAWVSFIMLFIGIWIQPKKGELIFKNRLANPGKHKIRILFTLVAFAASLTAFILLNQQKYANNYPAPALELMSSDNYEGDPKSYKLIVSAESADEVSLVGGSEFNKEGDDLFSLIVELQEKETTFTALARNEYKFNRQDLTITRADTEAEAQYKLEDEIYEAVQLRMDQIFEEPNKHYLETAVLTNEWDRMKVEEVAELYDITTEEVDEISIKVAVRRSETTNNSSPTMDTQAQNQQGGKYKLQAHTCAKIEVEEMLRNPKSADFPLASFNDTTTYLGNDSYKVESYLDAENSFGAAIRTNYGCIVEVKDEWSCTSSCELW